MKNICFVTCGELPVPAISGGAIEQLIEILINENELHPQFNFTVIEGYNKTVKYSISQYRYTKFVFIRQPAKWIQKKIWWKLRGLMRKLISRDYASLLPYNKLVINYLCKNGGDFDYIVCEGCDVGVFLKPSRLLGCHKFIFHIHCETFATPLIESIFDNIIAVGKFVEKQFILTRTRRDLPVWILQNTIDISKFTKPLTIGEKNRIRKKLGFSPNDFLIIYCGRLVDVKGVRELIKAVISIDNPKIKLMIVGSSNFRNAKMTDYQRSILKMATNYRDKIKFTGYIDNTILYKYYKIADIAVIPSIWEEAFNLVLVEFLASGIPTIATDSGEMKMVGTQETTLFIDKKKDIVRNIEKAIIMLYNNPVKLKIMSEKSIERSHLFDKSKYLFEFANIIRRL